MPRRRSPYTDLGLAVSPGQQYRESATFSFAIMAHEKRAGWVPDLVEQISGVKVVWDQHNDRHETGLRSILAYDPAADYHVVVQDDALLAPDFVEGLAEAIKFVPPGSPVGLYYGRGGGENKSAMLRAIREGASWLSRPGPVWGPGIVFPSESIPDLVEHYQSIDHVPNYDRRIMRYYVSVGKPCFYPVPSLVNHRTGDNPSLASPDRSSDRQAHLFVGPQSALSVDWSGPVVGSRKL